MKGRYIGQNIIILEDISFFTKQKKLPRILLSIDFEKAFFLTLLMGTFSIKHWKN